MRLLGLVLTVAFVYQVKCQIFDINYTLHNCALKKNAKFSRSSDDDDDDDGLHLIIMIFFIRRKAELWMRQYQAPMKIVSFTVA